MRVLVVDDEPDTVASLSAVLRDDGFEVQGVQDGRAGLSELDQFDPDVVLVDIAMPGMTGWDFAREVRNRSRGDRVALIALTGAYTKVPDELLSRIAGFNFFFTKPYDPNALIRLLRSFTLRRR